MVHLQNLMNPSWWSQQFCCYVYIVGTLHPLRIGMLAPERITSTAISVNWSLVTLNITDKACVFYSLSGLETSLTLIVLACLARHKFSDGSKHWTVDQHGLMSFLNYLVRLQQLLSLSSYPCHATSVAELVTNEPPFILLHDQVTNGFFFPTMYIIYRSSGMWGDMYICRHLFILAYSMGVSCQHKWLPK